MPRPSRSTTWATSSRCSPASCQRLPLAHEALIGSVPRGPGRGATSACAAMCSAFSCRPPLRAKRPVMRSFSLTGALNPRGPNDQSLSVSRRRRTGDFQFPESTSQVERRQHQEGHCPSVGLRVVCAEGEGQEAANRQDDSSPYARASPSAEPIGDLQRRHIDRRGERRDRFGADPSNQDQNLVSTDIAGGVRDLRVMYSSNGCRATTTLLLKLHDVTAWH